MAFRKLEKQAIMERQIHSGKEANVLHCLEYLAAPAALQACKQGIEHLRQCFGSGDCASWLFFLVG